MRKILIVDDLKPFIEEEKNILSRSDVHIFTATSGSEALSIHKNVKVDLMVVDLDMPSMTGDELCSLVRKDPDLKFVSILMVTRPRETDIARCKNAARMIILQNPLNQRFFLRRQPPYSGCNPKGLQGVCKLSVNGEKEHAKFSATSINISTAGLLIETPKVLNIEDIVNCSFFLPELLLFPLRVRLSGRLKSQQKMPASTE